MKNLRREEAILEMQQKKLELELNVINIDTNIYVETTEE